MIDALIIYGNIFTSLLELTINLKQIHKLFISSHNKESQTLIKDESEFKKMKSYNITKLSFSSFQSLFFLFKLIYIIKKNLYFKGYEFIKQSYPNLNIFLTQIIFMKLSMSIESLFSIPFSLFSTFKIEQKYGFNKTDLKTFITDYLKTEILLCIILPPIMYLVLYLIQYFTHNFYLYVFVCVVLVQIVMVCLFPILIQPLFNKFEELEESSLKNKIVQLAKEIGFKPSAILKMDGSKRSHHSNAYFIGLFKEKRIVLFDTLLTQCNENEIIAILCHEFGHWVYSHTWKNMAFAFTIMYIYFYTFNIFVNNSGKFMEMADKYPMIMKLNYFSMAIVIISPLLTLIQNTITRVYERQADKYAVKMGYGNDLKDGLVKIHVENKSNMCPDTLYSAYYHSHPTLVERIRLIDSEMKKIK